MRRSTKAVLVLLGAALATAGVTTDPAGPPPVDEGGSRQAVEDAMPVATVHSSTRGALAVALEASPGGGRPFDPGGQAAAARRPERSDPPEGVVLTGTSRAAESVIGVDGRVRVQGRTARYPNSAIGRIDFRQGGRLSWCTGALIDADTVLTAGHCVHDGLGTEAGWSTRVTFRPGVEGNQAPFGSCGSRELLTLPGWYEDGSEDQDLGLIQLDCAIGNTTGWFGFRSTSRARGLAGVPVHVRGYPGDKPWSTLWDMRDRVRVSEPLLAFYAADTYAGQSGSPVFNARRCNGTRGPCVLAVHAYGVHPGGPHATWNHGPRFDAARSALLAALAASPV